MSAAVLAFPAQETDTLVPEVEPALVQGDGATHTLVDPSPEQMKQWKIKGTYDSYQKEIEAKPELEWGGAVKSNIAYQENQPLRGGFAPGASEIALGINRFTEKTGKLPVFGWTYFGYSTGLQPSNQKKQITPAGTLEFPDQVSITFPPRQCESFTSAKTEIISSTSSTETIKKQSGNFNVGATIPLEVVGIPLTLGSKYSRGWSNDQKDASSLKKDSKSHIEKSQVTMSYAHFYLKDVRSVSQDFVDQTKELNKTYAYLKDPNTMPLSVVHACSGVSNSTCATKAWSDKVRFFLSMFGTDFMIEGTLGGKMTKTSVLDESSQTKTTETTRSSSTNWETEGSISVLPKLDAMANEKKKMEYADATGIPYTAKAWGSTGKSSGIGAERKTAEAEAAAKAKADKEDQIAAKAKEDQIPDKEDQIAEDQIPDKENLLESMPDQDASDGKKLLFSRPGRELLQSVTGKGGRSDATSTTDKTSDTSTKSSKTDRWHFYGCTPQADNFAWCASCAAIPVAIEYQLAPISNLVRGVMGFDALADELETFVKEQYHSECLPGSTWDEQTGICIQRERCPAGTKHVPFQPTTSESATSIECECTCSGKTSLTEQSMLIGTKSKDEKCEDFPNAVSSVCRNGLITDCKKSNVGKDLKTNVVWGAVKCADPGPAATYDCANPVCNLKRRCEATPDMVQDCACPLQLEQHLCLKDNTKTWYSEKNEFCTATEPGPCPSLGQWCGPESSSWSVCPDDGSFYHVSLDQCKGSRQCAGDATLFSNACPLQGITKLPKGQRYFAANSILPNSKCEKCPVGTYSEQENSGTCTKCPAGKSGSIEGAANPDGCKACPEGKGGDNCASYKIEGRYRMYIKDRDSCIAYNSDDNGDRDIPGTKSSGSRWAYWENNKDKCSVGDHAIVTITQDSDNSGLYTIKNGNNYLQYTSGGDTSHGSGEQWGYWGTAEGDGKGFKLAIDSKEGANPIIVKLETTAGLQGFPNAAGDRDKYGNCAWLGFRRENAGQQILNAEIVLERVPGQFTN